jgi:phosphate/sulfate permease
MTLVLTVIVVALVFEYINGFHDTANSIATVVSTRVLTPRQAIVLAAFTNLFGALVGTAVAKTIASGLVDVPAAQAQHVLICALLGAIVWDLVTWLLGLPTSSSHALIGGLCGAALAATANHWNSIIWSMPAAKGHWWDGKGLLYKVVIPMFTSPVCGLLVGFLLMALLYALLRNWRPVTVSRVFGKAQLLSAAYMGFSHGSNDAQKTMGIIALALMAGTTAGTFDKLPSFLGFLHIASPGPALYAAENLLGVMSRDGIGGSQSETKAVQWFQQAAEKKNPDAQENLAAMMQAGRGVRRDETAAAVLLKTAAEGRKGASPKPLALHAPPMKAVPTAPEAAVARFRLLIAEGRADAANAMVNLGLFLLEGKGGPADESQAVALFQKAAARNNLEAMANLGILHLQGRGVPRDEKAAREWFHRCVAREGIATWIKVVCALTMAAGTAAGGWRIIRTMGHKMVKLQPVHGFAAETTAATVLFTAAQMGMPVSTTHAISASIMGVGAAKRFNALKWTVVERILWAWFLTLPAAALIAYGAMWVARAVGWGSGAG